MGATLHDITLTASRKLPRPFPGKESAVAIPLLSVCAYGDPVPPNENVALSEVKIEEVLLAPLSWCLHPESGASNTSSILRSEEHTSELQSPDHLVCRLLLEKKKKNVY